MVDSTKEKKCTLALADKLLELVVNANASACFDQYLDGPAIERWDEIQAAALEYDEERANACWEGCANGQV